MSAIYSRREGSGDCSIEINMEEARGQRKTRWGQCGCPIKAVNLLAQGFGAFSPSSFVQSYSQECCPFNKLSISVSNHMSMV